MIPAVPRPMEGMVVPLFSKYSLASGTSSTEKHLLDVYDISLEMATCLRIAQANICSEKFVFLVFDL